MSGWQKFTIQMFSPCRVCEVVVFWIARDSKTLKNPLEIFTKRKKQSKCSTIGRIVNSLVYSYNIMIPSEMVLKKL